MIVWRRWHDGVFLAVAVLFEASVFVITSFIVGRDRPPVEQLDSVPPSGSFPSGHSAAGRRVLRVAVPRRVLAHPSTVPSERSSLVVAVVVPLVVATSRVYRGMHHTFDVVAGLALGLASIYVVRAAMRAGVEDIDRRADGSLPEQVRRLDLTNPPHNAAPGAVGGDR